MPVFRVERNKGYTVMSNYHLRDKSLSLKAKGLLSQILSLPEDWDYTLSGLCYINRESKDAIRSAVNELERAGYIERHQTTDESGKFSSNEYIIHEQPVSLPPSLDKPSSENPTTGKPTLESPTQLNKDRVTRPCLKIGGIPDWGRFFCQARRFDAGILTDFKSNQRSPGGKRCPKTALCHFSSKA